MTLRKILICFLVFLLPLSQTACSKNATTLDRIGAVAVQATLAFDAELASLRAAGLLQDAKYANLKRRADALKLTAEQFRDYLNTVSGVSNDNKPQILSKIAELVGIVGGIAVNPDLIGAKPDSTAVKILQIAVITLQNTAIAVAAINPPAAAKSAVATRDARPPVVAKEKVKIETPKLPADVKKYFNSNGAHTVRN